jgi:S-adenosylmethionine/arginine decarboxylase-like enzyme
MTDLRGPPNPQGRPRLQSPYRVLVPGRFIVQTIVASFLCAFALGRTARYILVEDVQLPSSLADKDQNKATYLSQFLNLLPTPVLPDGKRVPQTSYTSKNFDTARSSRVDSRWVLTEEATCYSEVHPNSSQTSSSLQDDDDTEEEDHSPAGQHLLLDFQFIDGEFLNSEVRLAHAMIQLVQECGLTLLSYHCHKLDPAGVSCAGVLLESHHVAFHTWPEHGVISLDLFTRGSNSLLPVVPIAQKLFSVSVNKDRQPRMRWAHNLRGFRDEDEDEVQASALGDMIEFPIGAMIDYKEEVRQVFYGKGVFVHFAL